MIEQFSLTKTETLTVSYYLVESRSGSNVNKTLPYTFKNRGSIGSPSDSIYYHTQGTIYSKGRLTLQQVKLLTYSKSSPVSYIRFILCDPLLTFSLVWFLCLMSYQPLYVI